MCVFDWWEQTCTVRGLVAGQLHETFFVRIHGSQPHLTTQASSKVATNSQNQEQFLNLFVLFRCCELHNHNTLLESLLIAELKK